MLPLLRSQLTLRLGSKVVTIVAEISPQSQKDIYQSPLKKVRCGGGGEQQFVGKSLDFLE